MRLVPLENISGSRLVFHDIRDFDFEPNETKRVHPAMLEHPSVKRVLGKSLRVPEITKEAPKVEEPKAPESLPSKPVKIEPEPTEPIAGEAASILDMEPEEETAGESLREAFIAAPGITESNVDAIMAKYTTIGDLADATQKDLQRLGVAKSFTKKLIRWAAQ